MTTALKYVRSTLVAFVICISGVSNAPAATTWKIDASHSKIIFTVTHMVINEVSGWFAEFEGNLTQPGDADFNGSSILVHIKTASVNTGSDGRDQHLRGPDFFEAEKFPVVTFTATRFKKINDNDYDVTGTLDLHGVSKPVQLQARFNGTVKDGRGNVHAGFKATTTFLRSDYGLTWTKTLETGGVLVSDKVDMTVNMELVKVP